jgi:transcriptional regulator with XRE-family HTH domain
LRRMTSIGAAPGVGPLLRDWRQRRRLSQLDLALEAGVSARHVSFVETGRARPSPEMLLQLAEHLDVPLRERNQMLLAAGYAPRYGERDLDDPEMQPVREAIQRVLDAHAPFPAVVVDRAWEMIAANASVPLLIADVAAHLIEPPVNVLRVSLHPEGMAPRIVNLAEWRAHLLERLQRQIVATGAADLQALYDEVSAYPGPRAAPSSGLAGQIAVPLRIRSGSGEVLSFISTVATFGTAVDITVAELAIESFFPADERTAEVVRAAAGG